MAALAASAVTILDTWKEAGTSSRKFLAREVQLVLTGQGDLTDNIPAALFGMKTIRRTLNFRTTASVAIQSMPSYDGSLLCFCTAETNGNPATQTGVTVRGIVLGYDT